MLYDLLLVLFQEGAPTDVLLSAYNLFQRVAIAVEMVWADLKDHGHREYRRKYGRWWRQATGRANRVIQSIYLSLHTHPSPTFNLSSLSSLRRDFVSESVRCIDPRIGETRRNMRDLTVLHNAIIITDFYRHMFVLYARHRIQHLLSQIDAQEM